MKYDSQTKFIDPVFPQTEKNVGQWKGFDGVDKECSPSPFEVLVWLLPPFNPLNPPAMILKVLTAKGISNNHAFIRPGKYELMLG